MTFVKRNIGSFDGVRQSHESKVLHQTEVTYFLTTRRSLKTDAFDTNSFRIS